MATFGKRPINDANAYKAHTHRVYQFEGEQRIERRPFGFVEPFVDPVGNVITMPMTTPGDPQGVQTALRVRAEKHAEGWVEHGKCPLKHGTRHSSPVTARDFRSLPASLSAPCDEDPRLFEKRNGELHAKQSCPHIEWLVTYRVEKEKAANAKRNKARVAEEKRKEEAAALQAAQLEMVKEQIAERKARKGKKDTTE